MEWNVKNLLYDNPELYEKIYPEPNLETPRMCELILKKYYRGTPESVFDIGCGIGRDLNGVSQLLKLKECVGIDLLPSMIAYAKEHYPHCTFQAGDMRDVYLDSYFDCIMCMGSVFMYALSNEDVHSTLQTFEQHAHNGTILILDIYNASGYLNGPNFKETTEKHIDLPEFKAQFLANHSFDRYRQVMIRERTWTFPDNTKTKNYCEYRLFFPAELDFILALYQFKIVGMFDNMQLRPTDLTGVRLYVVAEYVK